MKSRITVAHLATHTSGLSHAEEAGVPRKELTGWKGAFWRRDPAHDPFSIALDQAPVAFEPGTAVAYSATGYAVLAYVLAAAAKRAGEEDLLAALRREIMEPLGIPDAAWFVGYGQSFPVHGVEAVPNWGGAAYTARAAARLGQLFVDDTWRDKTTLDRSTLEATTVPSSFPSEDGTLQPTLGWYSNASRAFAHLPTDAIVGAGDGHQVLVIVPSMNLVAVRFGSWLDDPDTSKFWHAVDEHFFRPLMTALRVENRREPD